jgi:hypothetical protein
VDRDWRLLLGKILCAIGSHEGAIFEWAWDSYGVSEDEKAAALKALEDYTALTAPTPP